MHDDFFLHNNCASPGQGHFGYKGKMHYYFLNLNSFVLLGKMSSEEFLWHDREGTGLNCFHVKISLRKKINTFVYSEGNL